jgi:hypothetical protein
MRRHNERMTTILEQIIASGMASGEFPRDDACLSARLVYAACNRFIHPRLIVEVEQGALTLDQMIVFCLTALTRPGASLPPPPAKPEPSPLAPPAGPHPPQHDQREADDRKCRMPFLDMDSEVRKLRDEEDRVQASFTRRLIEVAGSRRSGASPPAVNAGESLQRPAGVKVQHGRKQEGPDIGAFLLVSFHS